MLWSAHARRVMAYALRYEAGGDTAPPPLVGYDAAGNVLAEHSLPDLTRTRR
ncbi:hypothetical protein [Phytohabitans kaempferiae]|uniref:Uncharacterized protein n=1 Tax=Phytohabitans kaempferiae TaxID=1620943 RepID=A0ABV6LYG6_9ACTN